MLVPAPLSHAQWLWTVGQFSPLQRTDGQLLLFRGQGNFWHVWTDVFLLLSCPFPSISRASEADGSGGDSSDVSSQDCTGITCLLGLLEVKCQTFICVQNLATTLTSPAVDKLTEDLDVGRNATIGIYWGSPPTHSTHTPPPLSPFQKIIGLKKRNWTRSSGKGFCKPLFDSRSIHLPPR